MNNQMNNQSESDKMFNQFYKTKIDRPYANIDLTRIPSWDMVIRIMEQQAMAARLQHPVPKYSHGNQQQNCQSAEQQMESQSSQNQQPDLIPIHISCDYQEYHTFNGNHGNSNGEDSDVSSYCSSRNSSSAATSTNSSEESDGSDIEIDVEDCSDDNSDEDYYMIGSSMDNIPLTVLQLESKIREREC